MQRENKKQEEENSSPASSTLVWSTKTDTDYPKKGTTTLAYEEKLNQKREATPH